MAYTIIATALVTSLLGPPQPVTGTITRHDAIPEVLDNRPWLSALADDADGFIATTDCEHLGGYVTLIVQGKAVRLLVVDCAWPRHKPWRDRNGIIADVGELTWQRLGLPPVPVPARLLLPSTGAVTTQGGVIEHEFLPNQSDGAQTSPDCLRCQSIRPRLGGLPLRP